MPNKPSNTVNELKDLLDTYNNDRQYQTVVTTNKAKKVSHIASMSEIDYNQNIDHNTTLRNKH
jgi:hypothetical protein